MPHYVDALGAGSSDDDGTFEPFGPHGTHDTYPLGALGPDRATADADGSSGDEGDGSGGEAPGHTHGQAGRWVLVRLQLLQGGTALVWFVLQVVAMPSQIRALVGDRSKGLAIGSMAAANAVVSLVGSPLCGLFSDRLRSGRHRRLPVVVVGALVTGLLLQAMAFACPTIPPTPPPHPGEGCAHTLAPTDPGLQPSGGMGTYTVAFVLVSAGYLFVQVPYSGVIADMTPSHLRGFSSGTLGAMNTLGQMAGALVGVAYAQLGVHGTYALLASVMATAALATGCSVTEHVERSVRPHKALSVAAVVAAYIEPMRDHDFRWVFFTRLLMQQGVSTVLNFLEYWLVDVVALPEGLAAERAVGLVFLPMLAASLLTALGGGWASDRMGGRRRALVMGAGTVMALAAMAMCFLRRLRGVVAAATVLGAGYGVFVAVDFAMVLDVLPDAQRRAQDLAVWHSALVLPQILATPLGGWLRDTFQTVGCGCECGLGYKVLFSTAAVYFALSALLVTKIRNIR